MAPIIVFILGASFVLVGAIQLFRARALRDKAMDQSRRSIFGRTILHRLSERIASGGRYVQAQRIVGFVLGAAGFFLIWCVMTGRVLAN